MLSMLASLAIRRPRQMLLLALAVFLISAAFGATAIGLLNARNPFSDPAPPAPAQSRRSRMPPAWKRAPACWHWSRRHQVRPP